MYVSIAFDFSYALPAPRCTGGDRICPLLDFLNNSKIVADIDTKFDVPYPTSIWQYVTKFGRNRSEFCWEIDVFVGSLHANFDQNRLNVKKFAKNRVLTLALAGGGCPPPLRFFCDAPRTMRRIVLKFCIAYGTSFAQRLVKKCWPGHVRSRSYDVRRGTRSGHFCER